MPVPYIDESRLQTDSNVIINWAINALGGPFVPIPSNIKSIMIFYLNVALGLVNDNLFRQTEVNRINQESGAVPPP